MRKYEKCANSGQEGQILIRIRLGQTDPDPQHWCRRYLVGPAPNPGQERGGVEAGASPLLFLLVFLVKALSITEKKREDIFLCFQTLVFWPSSCHL